MVVQLNLLAHHLVSHIIRKMEPVSFRNACLASRCILKITDKYKKYIKFHLKGYQVELTKTTDDDNLQLYIYECGSVGGCLFGSEELLETFPDFAFFVFEEIALYCQPEAGILHGLCEKHITCDRLDIEARGFVNETIRAFRPRELILTCEDVRKPSEYVEHEHLKSINALLIRIIEEAYVMNCLEEIAPRMQTLTLDYHGDLPLTILDDFLDGIKTNMIRIINGCALFLNTHFKFNAEIERSNKLLEIIRTFQDIPHTVWKRCGLSRNRIRTNYVMLFYRIPNGSTLVLFLREKIERRSKYLCVAYEVLSNTEQFLNFFEDCLLMTNDEAVKELTCGRKRRRQFTELKKEYFGNKT